MKFEEGYYITPSNLPNKGILFVDHAANNRSGHLGHALVQCENGDILAFYPNCSDDGGGHSAVGWMEYKRSRDFGKTWEPPMIYTYSKQYFQLGINTSVMAEKAVVTNDGTIVIFQKIHCGNLIEYPPIVVVLIRVLHGRKLKKLIRIAGAYMMQYIMKKKFLF